MINKEKILGSSVLYIYRVGNTVITIEKKQAASGTFLIKTKLNDMSSWRRNSVIDKKTAILFKSDIYRLGVRVDNYEFVRDKILEIKENVISDYIKFRYNIDESSSHYVSLYESIKAIAVEDFNFEKQ